MREVTRYVAFDDKEFTTRDECERYEAEHGDVLLLGMDMQTIEALRRGDPEQVMRALAIERFGRMLAKLRIQSGGLMRRRKPKGGAAATLANETPPSPIVSRAGNARPRIEYTDRFNGDPPPGRSALDRERATRDRLS
jgi:hypothetical protein